MAGEIGVLSVQCRIMAPLVFAVLGGCVVVPTPELSEIRNSRLEFIEPGVTTRSTVEINLLSEDVFEARVSGPYTVYAEYRRAPFSVISETSASLMGDVDDYLVVEYDESDRVVRFDRIRRENGCTDYGLCVRGGAEYNAGSVIVYGPDALDAALKTFTRAAGVCSVYVYVDGGLPCNGVGVSVSASYPGMVSLSRPLARVDGYFEWQVPSGSEGTVAVTLRAERRGGMLASYEFDCDDGEIAIVALELESCAIGSPRATFLSPSATDGRAAISERRLMLR